MFSTQDPIDIHCSKLVDWLVQRRHCKKDWGDNLASIHLRIRSALGDMPENDEIKQLLIDSKLDYFKSKRIVDILKTTEASSKNIFGFYSSQRMKDWQDIVNSYEKDYVYLAEIATDLIRDTNYEVPTVRKVIDRLKQDKTNAEKERASLLKRAQLFQSEYQRLAQSYGIAGVNIEQEFNEKSKTLSSVMDEIVNLSKGLESELDYYREYSCTKPEQDKQKILSLLHYVITKGNTTVYEWKYGEAPESIIKVEKAYSAAGNSNPSEIELIDDEIDFGEDPPSSESSSGFVHVDKSDNGNGNIEESYIKVEEGESNVVCDVNDKIARGDDARLVLELRKPRNLFLNNLYELEAFFAQLSIESNSKDDKMSSFMADTSSARARQYNINEINQITTKIRQIMNIMNSEKNKILFQMNDSPVYLESIKEKFASKLKQASECNTKAEYLIEHIADLENQIKDTEIHLTKAIKSAKALQEKVSSSIGDLYSGRPINIMSCVH